MRVVFWKRGVCLAPKPPLSPPTFPPQQTLFEENLATADDRAATDGLLARLAETRAAAATDATSAARTAAAAASLEAALPPILTARTAAGAPRALAFVDADTVAAALAAQAAAARATARALPPVDARRAREVRGRRWLAIAADAKLVLLDLASGERRELARGALDAKAPTTVAALARPLPPPPPRSPGGGQPSPPAPLAPALVVGTAGGASFIISLTTALPIARLAGGHRAAVTVALPLASPSGDGDALITASVDGSVALWTVTAPPADCGGGSAALPDLSPTAVFDAHAGAVLAAALAPAPGASGPGGGPLRLITLGADRELAAWELGSWRCAGRGRPFTRGAADALATTASPGAHAGLDPPILLTSGAAGGLVFAARADAPGAPAALVADGTPSLPTGTKREPKVYAIAAHPTHPWTVALAANAGVLLLAPPRGGPPPAPPVAGVPPLLGAPAGAGCAFAIVHGRSLWLADFAAGWREEVGGARALTADLRARGAAAPLPDAAPPSCPRLLASDCGRYVAAVWRRGGNAGGVFAVWERPGDGLATRPSGGGASDPVAPASGSGVLAWTCVAEGTATDVAWAAGAPRLAVLVPGARASASGGKRGTTAPASPPAPARPTVDFVEFEGSGAPGTLVAVDVLGRGRGDAPTPTRLHGGSALAVARSDGRATLHPWNDPSSSSPPIPSPVALAWAPRAAGVALAYPSRVDVCAARGGGSMITRSASLPVRRVVGAAWDGARLVLLTPDAVHVAVVGGLGGEAPPSIDISIIAAATPPRPLPDAASTPLASLPPVQRPPGPLALVSVSESAVWVVDGAGRPHPLPLASPASRARALAATGDVGAAAAVAERGLPRFAHADAAAFFAAVAGPAGAAAGARLAGVPPRARGALLRAAGDAPGAVAALEDAAGVTPSFSTAGFGSAAVFGPLSDGGGDGGERLPARSDDASDTSGDAPPPPDWAAAAAAATHAGLLSRRPTTDADPETVAPLLPDALAAASGAWAAGDADATRRALTLALAAAPALIGTELEAVLLRAARGGLAAEAAAAVAALGGSAPRGAACYAAALSGDPASAARAAALRGDPHIAAFWTTAWKDGGSSDAVAAWERAVAAANGGDGASVAPPV